MFLASSAYHDLHLDRHHKCGIVVVIVFILLLDHGMGNLYMVTRIIIPRQVHNGKIHHLTLPDVVFVISVVVLQVILKLVVGRIKAWHESIKFVL